MRLKIESDGSTCGTKITAEDGSEIRATELVFRHKGGEIPTAEVTLHFVDLTASVSARMVGPNGKDVRRIEYMDGTEERFDGVTPIVTLGDDKARWVKDTPAEMLNVQCRTCRGSGRDSKDILCGRCRGTGTLSIP